MAPRYRVTLTVEERSELKALTRAATKTTASGSCTRGLCCCATAGRKGRDGPWPGWPRRWASRPARSST